MLSEARNCAESGDAQSIVLENAGACAESQVNTSHSDAEANLPNWWKPPRTFTALERFFVWLCLAVGYAVCRVFPVGAHPLGGFLLILAMFGGTSVVLKCKGYRFGKLALLAAASAVVIAFSLLVCANEFLRLFAYLYAMAVYCYFLYKATGNAVKGGFTDLIVVDFFKALLVLPFFSFQQLFRAIFSGKKGGGKWVGKLIAGILIAVAPTAAVLVLLSYDSNFSALLQRLFDFNFTALFSHIGSFCLGLPIAMYLFGLFLSATDHKASDILTAQTCETASRKIKVAPAVTVAAAVTPLLFVYVIFFFSQWKYYVSGFTGVLPQEFSYAQYAREGFFQLCAVSVINLAVIVLAVALMRRKTESPPVLLKLLTVLYSLFTLVLISTAIAKMVLYIDCYGLTPKRVYATWFMIVLAIVFILVAVRQFVQKLRAVAVSLSVLVVCFAVLSLSNVDAWIARYNVGRYLDGSLQTVDMEAMETLGDAAIPELVHLSQALKEKESAGQSTEEDRFLAHMLQQELFSAMKENDSRADTPFSFSLPSYKAKRALDEWASRFDAK